MLCQIQLLLSLSGDVTGEFIRKLVVLFVYLCRNWDTESHGKWRSL